MKVLTLISGGDTGGAKTHVHSLLKGLNEHIQADMICFTDGPFASEARELGIRVDVIPGDPLSALKALKERIRAEGYDLIHCHGARGNLMGALLKRSTGLPVVTTVHSDPKLDYMGRPLAAATFGVLNNWALRVIRYHIGVSRPMADLLIDRGFDPQQVFTIPNGLPFDCPAPALDRSAYLSSLGLDWPEDAVIVGIAARLNPVKDIPTLLQGLAKALKEQPKLRLIVAGDGEEGPALKQLTEELGIEHQVCFAGWVTDTNSFYNAVDINALSSLSEGFPYALVEGARFSLPTVATRVGGVPDLVENGSTGLLFEPKDVTALAQHLAVLAADPALRRRLGHSLWTRAREEYSLDSTVRHQLEIYEAVLRRHMRPRKVRDGAVICGAYGQDNAGDEAVLRAIIGELRTIDPDLPLWVMTRKPKEVKKQYRAGAVYTFNVPGFCRRMAKSRLYVNGGGSLVQDVSSRRSLLFYLFTLSAAKRLGCRVMMYGCGIGPVNSSSGQKQTAKVINHSVDAITLRDRGSLDTLKKLGVSRPEIVLAADPALTLPAAPPETADALLAAAGLDPEHQRYLGITVRPWQGLEDKAPAFAAAADFAWEELGLTTVFVPIVGDMDTAAAKIVAAHIQKAPYAVLPPCPRTEDTIALFARMEVMLSMRLHALIFAAGHGVPLVGAVYDPKVSAFLDELEQDLHIPFDQVTAGKLIPLIRSAAQRSGDRAALEAKAVRLLQLEANNSIIARKLLER